MGIAKEQLYDNQQEVFYESMAERLGITYDEAEEIEPQINENTGSDGAVYGYYLSFKEDAPREILDKIEGLDSNDWYWMDISEVYDEDYDEEQYIAETVLRYGKKIYYDSDIQINHMEGMSTGKVNIRTRYSLMRKANKRIIEGYY